MDDSDYEALKWVLEFNKFDLYTKDDDAQWLQPAVSDDMHDMSIRTLWPYYQSLIDKYFPTDTLKW
jgi:inositol oxygenase